MTRKQLTIMLMVLFIVDGIVVGALISATASPTIGVPVGVAAMVFPFVLVYGLTALLLRIAGWPRLARAFPARPALEGAKPKMCPQFVAARMALNNAVEYAVDDDCLHLTPMFASRLSAGVSIPWEHIEFPEDSGVKKTRFGVALVPITAVGVKMKVPLEAVQREMSIRRAIREDAAEPLVSQGG